MGSDRTATAGPGAGYAGADALIDFDRVIADASHVRAKKGGAATGPSPVDRRKQDRNTTS
ncbi:hypothetical protein ACWEKR_05340 [Nocardia sp. NPDC004573]